MSRLIEKHELGLMREIKESLLKDIINFYDTVERFPQKFKDINDKKLSHDLELLRDEVEEILFRNDVVRIEHPDSKFYNRDLQKVIRKEPTAVEADQDTVAKIIRQGFRLDQKILRKQEVIIREYTPGLL